MVQPVTAKRVLIHALGADMGGALRHLTHFLPALSQSQSILITRPHYIILIRNKIKKPPEVKHITFISLPNCLSSSFIMRFIFDNLLLPIYLKLKNIDTVVSLTNFGPLWGAKTIVFQLNLIYFSRWYYQQLPFSKKPPLLLRRFLSYFLMKRAKMIVVPSQSMRDRIIEQFKGLDPEKFTIFPHAIELPPAPLIPVKQSLITLFQTPCPIFLYPSHLAAHKGYDILLQGLGALKRLYHLDFRCLLTCSLEEWPESKEPFLKLIQKQQIQNEVTFIGMVSHHEMTYLYQNSTLVVFPSILESFGYPLVEALSHGVPLIAADTEINREICQDGALYYPPFNPEALAAQLKAAFDPEIRKKLSQKAKSQFASRDWSWGTYVRDFEKLI